MFSRSLELPAYSNKVIIGLDLQPGNKTLDVSTTFQDGTKLTDAYCGISVTVKNGAVAIDSKEDIVLPRK